MAKFYSGQDGKLFVDNATGTIGNTDEVAKVRSWSFTINTSVLETVSLGDFDRRIIPGLTSLTGSASIYYYAESTTAKHNSGLLSTMILDKILPRSDDSPTSEERPQARFKLQADANHFIEIVGIITSFAMTNSVGEVMAADISFESDGIAKETTF